MDWQPVQEGPSVAIRLSGDVDAIILSVDSDAAAVLGSPTFVLEGQTVASGLGLSAGEAVRLHQLLVQGRSAGETVEACLRVRHCDGSQHWQHWRLTPLAGGLWEGAVHDVSATQLALQLRASQVAVLESLLAASGLSDSVQCLLRGLQSVFPESRYALVMQYERVVSGWSVDLYGQLIELPPLPEMDALLCIGDEYALPQRIQIPALHALLGCAEGDAVWSTGCSASEGGRARLLMVCAAGQSCGQHEASALAAAAQFMARVLQQRHFGLENAALTSSLQQAQKMEAIGQLTGGIAHDFNNILASMMGYAELIGLMASKDAIDTARVARYTQQILDSGSRARDLIKQMLLYSRSDSVEKSDVVLADIIDNVLALVQPSVPAGVRLISENGFAGEKVHANATQLHQVLLNLIINARDALGQKGNIRVTGGVHQNETPVVCTACQHALMGAHAVFTVEDDGPGIPPEALGKIFQPFFTTKPVGQGTGMGLAVAHGIVHDHGGHIHVDSRPGRTRFRVYLPLVVGSAAEDDARAAMSLRLPGVRRVLIVDDEASLGRMLAELLTSLGVDSEVLTDVREARRAIAKRGIGYFDAYILDNLMPGETGIAFAESLRKEGDGTPILLCSGQRLVVPPVNAIDVVYKPLDLRRICAALQGITSPL